MAKYLLGTSSYGVSSYQLAQKLNIRQATAWHLRHRVSEFFKDDLLSTLLSGVVQSDEAVIGGRNQFRHRDKKYAWIKGEAGKDKTWILGLASNDDAYVRVFVIPNRKAKTLIDIILKNIASGATIVTDDYLGYKRLWERYTHIITKMKGNFRYKTDEGFHTNRIEGFWTHLKRAYKGVYHHMSRKHLQRYCDEVCFRYNNSGLGDFYLFEKLMNNIPRGTLRYKDLVGKNSKKAA